MTYVVTQLVTKKFTVKLSMPTLLLIHAFAGLFKLLLQSMPTYQITLTALGARSLESSKPIASD